MGLMPMRTAMGGIRREEESAACGTWKDRSVKFALPSQIAGNLISPPVERPVTESIHVSRSRRRVVIHADDLGMCHGANVAFADLFARGVCTSGSVMAPCP